MGIWDVWEENFTRGISEISRGVNEAVFPPMDVFWADNNIRVLVDLAGFDINDIDVELERNVLHIRARRESIEKQMDDQNKEIDIIQSNRPLRVRTRVPLPFTLRNTDKLPELKEPVTKVDGVVIIDIIKIPTRFKAKPQAN